MLAMEGTHEPDYSAALPDVSPALPHQQRAFVFRDPTRMIQSWIAPATVPEYKRLRQLCGRLLWKGDPQRGWPQLQDGDGSRHLGPTAQRRARRKS